MRPRNKQFQKRKNVILFIYDNKCIICNDITESKHIHHIDHNHFNNDPFNMVPLCKNCHINTHKLSIKIQMRYTDFQLEMLTKLESFY